MFSAIQDLVVSEIKQAVLYVKNLKKGHAMVHVFRHISCKFFKTVWDEKKLFH